MLNVICHLYVKMSTYEISKSSLLSLKAEILRKQDELSKAKADNEVKIRNLKKTAPLDLKNKGIEQRQAQDNSVEEDLLKKSREALEAKSQLYDKLSKKTRLSEREAEYYRHYLVRFDKKSNFEEEEEDDIIDDYYEPPRSRDEEWVEYVDCLGRTRTCLRKDLQYLKEKDKDLEQIVDEKRRARENSPSRVRRNKTPEPPPKEKTPELEITDENELLSNDMRREILRKQWEKEEEELRNKSDIHYQDILFNEARSHGVGYYSFSKDEDVRARQQEALRKLREETKQQQKKSQELKAMREKQLAARIRAAKNRKRERMGLPPLEEDEIEAVPEPQQEPEEKIEERDKEIEEKRKKHVRPWDIGKEGVKRSHYEHTQEEWVEKKRRERREEFAPPETYRDKRKRREFRASPIRNELSDDEIETRGRRAEVAPPSCYDLPKRKRRDSISSDVSESIEAGLKYLREQIEKKQDVF